MINDISHKILSYLKDRSEGATWPDLDMEFHVFSNTEIYHNINSGLSNLLWTNYVVCLNTQGGAIYQITKIGLNFIKWEKSIFLVLV